MEEAGQAPLEVRSADGSTMEYALAGHLDVPETGADGWIGRAAPPSKSPVQDLSRPLRRSPTPKHATKHARCRAGQSTTTGKLRSEVKVQCSCQ